MFASGSDGLLVAGGGRMLKMLELYHVGCDEL